MDLKHPEYRPTDADEFELLDLRRWDNCLQATRGVDDVFALAADMVRVPDSRLGADLLGFAGAIGGPALTTEQPGLLLLP